MTKAEKDRIKRRFRKQMEEFIGSLHSHVSAPSSDGQWTVKGFIDIYKNIYTISGDTKIVSKIIEIHLFPKILEFAQKRSYKVVLAEHQNYYPDLTFISKEDDAVKLALDLKTTYRLPDNPEFCNGFTLGSHGSYFLNRKSRKNIQFPYEQYLGHYCLGVIYTRSFCRNLDALTVHSVDQLLSITSVIRDFQFFVREKWEIASDSQGSGNTANIGSIMRIQDLLGGNGAFKHLGEKWFDDYWMNYGKITIRTAEGKTKKITKLAEFLRYRGEDPSLANPWKRPSRRKRRRIDE